MKRGLRFAYTDNSKLIANEPIDTESEQYWDAVDEEIKELTNGKRQLDRQCCKKTWGPPQDPWS